jgi:predicted PolB exonuclease-like 3'-5' exonuclease
MIMFFDIETIPDTLKTWEFLEKHPDEEIGKMWLFAEFAKIICISCWFSFDDWIWIEFKTKSFSWEDEKKILEDFFNAIWKPVFNMVCWFNIINFDIPFVFKRALVNWVKIPWIISSYDEQNGWAKKPREMKTLDIMNVWKSTWTKNSSLDLVCKTLWIQSPKQDHDWTWVLKMFEEKNRAELEKYCEWDVKACYEIHRKIKPLM